jgi:hypothetical protein
MSRGVAGPGGWHGSCHRSALRGHCDSRPCEFRVLDGLPKTFEGERVPRVPLSVSGLVLLVAGVNVVVDDERLADGVHRAARLPRLER